MPKLFVACPSTGKPIETHLDVSSLADIQHLKFRNVRILLMCPHCSDQFHIWKGENAFLDSSDTTLPSSSS